MKLGLDKAEDSDIIEAICGRLNYQPLLEDEEGNLTIPNPESNIDFTQRKIFEYVKNEMRAWFGDALRKVAEPSEKIIVDQKIDSAVTAAVAVDIKP